MIKNNYVKTILFGIVLEFYGQLIILTLNTWWWTTIPIAIALCYYVWLKREPQPQKHLNNYLLLFLLMWLIALVNMLLQHQPQPNVVDTLNYQLLHHHHYAWLFGLLCLETIIAPTAEEIIFRFGLMNYHIDNKYRWLFAIISAALFMYAHVLSFTPNKILPYLPITTILTIRYYYTGDLRGNIRWHGIYNLVIFVISFVL